MKKATILIALLMCVSVLNAQDIITQLDGTTIEVKITKVDATQVTYKKYSNLGGPSYVMRKDNVQMITYENGKRVAFNTTQDNSSLLHGEITYNRRNGKYSIGEVTLDNKMLKQNLSPNDFKKFRSGRALNYTGTVLSIIGGYQIGWCAGELIAAGSTDKTMLVTGCILTAGGLIIGTTGVALCNKAVSNYNSSLAVMPTVIPAVSYDMPGSFDMNLGLALVFSF